MNIFRVYVVYKDKQNYFFEGTLEEVLKESKAILLQGKPRYCLYGN